MVTLPTRNPYLKQVIETLPRVLSLFDQDQTSGTYGVGDRFYWAWSLIDFGNGTFQGAAHGLARIYCAGLWPYPGTSEDYFLNRIDAIFIGTKALIRPDGSLEEAFPREGSFCVTALVAFDLLCTIELMNSRISSSRKSNWIAIIQPLIEYLIKTDERHAFISNHLATASAALFRWNALVGDSVAEETALALLKRILAAQSDEGWFLEYGGADPGYQSLCTYYLADINIMRPDLKLLEPLRKSIDFLSYFVHPDGSFGGLYGSRSTRFYYPSGLLSVSPEVSTADHIVRFLETSIQTNRLVTLQAIDEPNLMPMFNSYCWAAVMYHEQQQNRVGLSTEPSLPCFATTPIRKLFVGAGILVDTGPEHYTIINLLKGGVTYHYVHGKNALIDSGLVVRKKNKILGSTQNYSKNNYYKISQGTVTCFSEITKMNKRSPTPANFFVLRFLSLTIFRSYYLRELIKAILVKILITDEIRFGLGNFRRISLGRDIEISDSLSSRPDVAHELSKTPFVSVHMASKGYWQVQDEGE